MGDFLTTINALYGVYSNYVDSMFCGTDTPRESEEIHEGTVIKLSWIRDIERGDDLAPISQYQMTFLREECFEISGMFEVALTSTGGQFFDVVHWTIVDMKDRAKLDEWLVEWGMAI